MTLYSILQARVPHASTRVTGIPPFLNFIKTRLGNKKDEVSRKEKDTLMYFITDLVVLKLECGACVNRRYYI